MLFCLARSKVRRLHIVAGGAARRRLAAARLLRLDVGLRPLLQQTRWTQRASSNQATITWDSTHDIFPATNIIFQYSSAFMIIVTTAVLLRQLRLLQNSSKQQSISTIYSCYQVRDTFYFFFICHIFYVCFSKLLCLVFCYQNCSDLL